MTFYVRVLSSIWYGSTVITQKIKFSNNRDYLLNLTHIKATNYLVWEQRHYNFHKERERSFSEYFLQDWKITVQNVWFCNEFSILILSISTEMHFLLKLKLDCLICFTLLLRPVGYTITWMTTFVLEFRKQTYSGSMLHITSFKHGSAKPSCLG